MKKIYGILYGSNGALIIFKGDYTEETEHDYFVIPSTVAAMVPYQAEELRIVVGNDILRSCTRYSKYDKNKPIYFLDKEGTHTHPTLEGILCTANTIIHARTQSYKIRIENLAKQKNSIEEHAKIWGYNATTN